MGEVDIKKLFEAGVHFGHKTSRWHPKMAPYIYGKRGEIHVIDLEKTVLYLEKALSFLSKIASEGKQIVFVGTKQQAKDIIKEAAESVGMPYVNERWLGGMLTNYKTISDRIKYLKNLEEKMGSGELESRYSKLEVQRFAEEIEQLNVTFGGVKSLQALPGALFVADVVSEAIAVREANRLGIPVVAVVDTNGDPSKVDYPIPGNDDAIKAIQLITNYVVGAIETGKSKRKVEKTKDSSEEKTAGKKPLTKAAASKTVKKGEGK